MYGKVFTSPDKDPYFLYSGSYVRQIEGSQKFGFSSTHTFNKAQLQMDLDYPKQTNAEIIQRLVIPASSIPDSLMAKDYQYRIDENDSKLKPTTYIALMDVESQKSGNVSFEIKLSKHEWFNPMVEETILADILYEASKKGYKIVVEINGFKFVTEYINHANAQGHFLLLDMEPSYLKYMPVSDKAKKAFHQYGFSQTTNSLKIGYIFKTNSSQQVSFYDFGYQLGDKKFEIVSNISMHGFPFDFSNATIYFNITCEDCLIFSSFSFKSGFALVANNNEQLPLKPIIPLQQELNATHKKHLDIFYGLEIRDGIEVGIGFQYDVVNDDFMLLNLSSKANATFSAHKSQLRYYFPNSCYSFFTALNVSLLQKGNKAEFPTIYNVSYPIGFYKEAPWMVGNYTHSLLSTQEKMLIQDICPHSSICEKYTLKLAQVYFN